ncbi:MAG: hypothetical protein K8J31_30490, partial [Anaerolineae bacterium]|nr:hypothetical protein [Anaerolineae bacterium]
MGVGLNPGTMPTGAVPYVGTDDIPTILAKVEAAGGKVLQTEMAVGDMGTIALFQDPDGNTIGAANFPQM